MKIYIEKEKLYNFLLILYINFQMFLDVFENALLYFFNRKFTARTNVQIIGFLILAVGIFLLKIKSINLKQILVILGSFLAINAITYISYKINPDIHYYLNRFFSAFMIQVFFMSIFISFVEDWSDFEKQISRQIYLVLLYAVMILVRHNDINHGYSMNFSYYSYCVSAYAFILGLQKKDGKKLLLSLFIILTNLYVGARGVLICYLLLLLFHLFRKYGDSFQKKNLIYLIFFTFIFYILLVNNRSIASMLYQFFPSRTLELMSKGRITILSGRELYYKNIWHEILEQPFKFRGILSDRIFLSRLKGIRIGDGFTAYVHNFLLEVLFQFGCIWGIIILFIFFRYLLEMFFTLVRNRNLEQELIFFSFVSFSYAIGQLAVSNSYLVAPSFGLLLGSMFNITRKKSIHRGKKQDE
ncbi:MAG: hypothetical protein MJ134_10055 [Lachnospiraceae bacterium]|nr:hypothetical protein [Lachnospiraceae bacterium]